MLSSPLVRGGSVMDNALLHDTCIAFDSVLDLELLETGWS